LLLRISECRTIYYSQDGIRVSPVHTERVAYGVALTLIDVRQRSRKSNKFDLHAMRRYATRRVRCERSPSLSPVQTARVDTANQLMLKIGSLARQHQSCARVISTGVVWRGCLSLTLVDWPSASTRARRRERSERSFRLTLV